MRNSVLLRQAVGKALLEEWDPIGINSFPEAADEYDAYVGDIVRILVNKANYDDVFKFLWQLETEHMGLDGDRPATTRFAIRLMKLEESSAADDLAVSRAS